ncbi:MAG: glycosyltransferase family 1 protein [Cryomorphaceae bacterium]|nr:MAG: glycosyltransferase family 1 protein [Cryomorphaceae bacterium]
MPKPRVLLLGKLPPPFMGPAVATQLLLRSRLNEWFDLHHFDTRLNTSVKSLGRFGWRKLWRSIGGYRQLHQLARSLKPDLALVPISQTTMGFLKDSLYVRILSGAGVKVLVQLRGSQFRNWYHSASPLTRWWVRNSLKKTEGVLVLGNNLRYLFEGLFPPEKIFVAPNGGDFPELGAKRVSAAKPLRLLYLSNFLPGKGFDLLLRALAALPQEVQCECVLNAYGAWDNPDYQERCLSLIQKHSLHQVHLHSPVSGADKWAALNNADVFAFIPTHPEGHPWAIVEAMAAGLPVLTSDQGAIVESVLHDQNGFVVNTTDETELAERITLLIRNPDLVMEMGRKSRARYESGFTEEHLVQRYRNIFNQTLQACAE